ncbi:MAG: phosphonate C-P lyase system protein PhnG [Rhodocyclaceae bacterium]|nr:phosphonate C-P lyase system protein PhnG [Rhodocyclaceae bacterium]
MYDSTEAQQARREWLGLLSRAPIELLEAWGAGRAQEYVWLKRPESGLAMVRARIGATGDRFNVGEMTLTRCALRMAGGQHGVAYVQGRSARRAELAAIADALLQDPNERDALERDLLQPLRARIAASRAARANESHLTKVEFLTVSRGDE